MTLIGLRHYFSKPLSVLLNALNIRAGIFWFSSNSRPTVDKNFRISLKAKGKTKLNQSKGSVKASMKIKIKINNLKKKNKENQRK